MCIIILDADERILEYDVDYVVVDHQSPFQRIQILHTINYGNLLVLDELQSIQRYFQIAISKLNFLTDVFLFPPFCRLSRK